MRKTENIINRTGINKTECKKTGHSKENKIPGVKCTPKIELYLSNFKGALHWWNGSLFFLIIILGITLGIFAGCKNIFVPEPPATPEAAGPGGGITVSLRLFTGSARSVMPGMKDLIWEITASSDGAEATVLGEYPEFKIYFPSKGEWTIEVKGKSGTEPSAKEIFTGIKKMEITGSTTSISIPLSPGDGMEEGTGTIDLTMTVPTDVKKVMYKLDSDTKFTDLTPSNGSCSLNEVDVDAGIRTLSLYFLDDTGMTVYMCTETVNVWNGVTSNQWIETSGEEYINNGEFVITVEMVDEFVKTMGSVVYVDASVNADTPATGSFFAPVKTVSKAVDILRQANPGGNCNGTIMVSGVTTIDQAIEVKNDEKLTVKGMGENASITNNAGRVFNIASGGSLTLEENITLTGTNDAGNGGAVYVNGGNFIMKNGSKITGSRAKYGGGVYVDSKGTFIMGGGTISKNSASSTGASGGGVCISDGTFTMSDGAVISGNTATSSGGGVFVSEGGKFTMEGGTIGGPEAESANFAQYGGGVYVNGGKFEMTGTAILQGNEAADHGGGVHILSGGIFTMNGGTIGGTAANTATYGGGVFVSGGTFDMNNGTISGNLGTQSGGGVHVNDGNFTMAGGTIGGTTPNIATYGGGVHVFGGTFTVSGSSPVITNNAADNVYLANGKTITIGDKGLTENARIGVITAVKPDATNGVKVTNTAVTNGNKIFTSDEGYYVDNKEDGVYLRNMEAIYKVSSGSETEGTFADALAAVNKPAGGTITLLMDINGTNAVFGAGNTTPITFTGGTKTSPITLDLNGKTINRGLTVAQANGSVIKMNGGVLTIKDSSATNYDGTNGTGTITGGNSVEAGGGIRMGNDSFLTLESGNIIGNFVTGAYGGGVYVTTGCTFTMEGGNIASNQTDQSNGQGGGVGASDGIFIINGGIITGNTAGKGGGVSIGSHGGFTMSGGTISGNTATQNGGGVYVSSTGSFTLDSSSAGSSPVISGNTGRDTSHNNVYLYNDKTLSITGKLQKTEDSGNIGISMDTPGVFTLGWGTSGSTDTAFFFSDDEIYKIEPDSGECKLVTNDSEVEYIVSGNTSRGTFADAIDAVNESGGTITLLKDINSNNAVFSADSANNQPITFSGGTEENPIILDLNGKTIDRGLIAAQANGSVIKIEGGALTIRDSSAPSDGTNGTGAITGGNSTTYGGGIFIGNNGSLTLENGSITGNKTGADGGGVYFSSNGTFTMSGGSIKSNVASNGRGGSNGGGVYLNGGTFTMSGTATIADNEAVSGTSKGGGIYLNSGTFNMKDGEITGNKAGRDGGGGVYFPWKEDGGLIFNLGDSVNPGTGTDPVIRNNTNYSEEPNNVYVESGALIEIVGDLLQNGEKNIGISKEDNRGDFAEKNGHDVSVNYIFSSDQDGCIVGLYGERFNISSEY